LHIKLINNFYEQFTATTPLIGDQLLIPDPQTLLALSDLSQRDRIQILQSEYAALRSEIVARTGFGFQIAAVALAGITWFMQQSLTGRPWLFWFVMACVSICFIIAIFVNARDLSRAAHRVKEIEYEVNSRAGEHLLIWETLGGVVTRMSLTTSFISMVRTLPRSELPPLDPKYLERDARIAKEKAKPPVGEQT
jgi:hypothetical protein